MWPYPVMCVNEGEHLTDCLLVPLPSVLPSFRPSREGTFLEKRLVVVYHPSVVYHPYPCAGTGGRRRTAASERWPRAWGGRARRPSRRRRDANANAAGGFGVGVDAEAASATASASVSASRRVGFGWVVKGIRRGRGRRRGRRGRRRGIGRRVGRKERWMTPG